MEYCGISGFAEGHHVGLFAVAAVKMSSIPQGQTVTAILNMTWMGVNQVTITRITFTGEGAD